MANDVQIKQIDSISVFATRLSDFSTVLSHDITVVSDMLAQKIVELEHIEEQSRSKFKAIDDEYHSFLNYYAYNKNADNLSELTNELHRLENRQRQAARDYQEIEQNVVHAKGIVMHLIDITKTFQRDVCYDVEQGNHFLQKSVSTLYSYIDNQKQL